jgi:hypothetical protein
MRRAFGIPPLLVPFLSGCCWLGSYQTPEGITRWQDPSPPQLSLREKAAAYQERIETKHLTPAGLVKYSIKTGQDDISCGDLSDGPFHTGIYLGSQALRYATTREPEAKRQVLLALNGLRLLMEVTGKRGLLARYFSRAPAVAPAASPGDPPGPPSETRRLSLAHPELVWRGDVSKDQYAGFIDGLGLSLALVDDPQVRTSVAELASAAADHLMENGMKIIDADGRRTTHGNLAGKLLVVPIGVNALISLAIAKVAAESTGDKKYRAFYDDLRERGYPSITYWAHFTVLGVGNRVNDNMAYLALYPLLLLEKSPAILKELRRGERRTWKAVREDRNAFFAFVHAAGVGDLPEELAAGQAPDRDGRARGREALFEFPDDKVAWPVDLTRPGFHFPRAFLNTRKCEPRTTRGVPLYLRPRSSSFWASDPFRLTGDLGRHGNEESAGADYLLAYWIGRYNGFIEADE